MTIRTQITVAMAVFGLALLVIAVLALVTSQRVEQLKAQEDIADSIQSGASDLSYLSGEYLLYGEPQQRTRWETRAAVVSHDLASLAPGTPEQQAIADSLQRNHERLKAIFADIVASRESSTAPQTEAALAEFNRLSWSRLTVQSQAMFFDASRLSQSLDDQADRTRQRTSLLVVALVVLFAAFIVASYSLTSRRVLRALAELQAGTAVVGAGNLDFRIEERQHDEVGKLASAFNLMTASLKTVSASKAELEREIAERAKVERALREREESLSEAQRIARIGSWSWDMETDVTTGSDELLRIYGFDPETQSIPNFQDQRGLWYPVEDWERVNVAVELAVRTGQGYELDVRAFQNGRPIWVTSRGEVVRDAADLIVGMRGTVQDITERKRAEEERERLLAEVEQRAAELAATNKELETFAYSVSHDLRTPLRSIDGFSRALEEDYGEHLNAEGKQYLARVQAAARRMGEYIDGLLGLSRLARQEIQPVRVNLSDAARAVAAELQRSEPERQVEFVIADGLVTEGDPVMLRAVLENLLGNAWKFTSKRENARIEFGQTRADEERSFYVRDNGAGFDMEYAGKLFGPFQRLHRESEFPGLGIGLATVQRIIHRHGGRVWAESKVGEGATFYFTLGRW